MPSVLQQKDEEVLPKTKQQHNGDAATTNGIPADTNGTHNSHGDDAFQHLPKPQQDILVLHGPGQKYSLQTTGQIPELRASHYNFGCPSYPWINGRDFAGIVVKTGKGAASRIKTGDVVFGPSTDYRDVRKAAYQEYLVTNDFNVARLPSHLSVNTAASVGVAFISALLALGISLGVNFANGHVREEGRAGPDIWTIARETDRDLIPEDVQDEVYEGIAEEERPRPGDWFAIWGASSSTGLAALQLAKLSGLKVIAVADSVRHGSRLVDLGADILVDRQDPARAIEIIRSVTKGRLKFALDTVGKETASHLQEALQRSAKQGGGREAHLVGLTGLPKTRLPNIRYHNVPIKVFHHAPIVGERAMGWLEELLVAKTLIPPEVQIAEGGLKGINGALDQLRNGSISGKRLVVPIDSSSPDTTATEVLSNGTGNGVESSTNTIGSLEYADQLNSDPSRIKFAYWVPNVSGGLVISKIPQRTKWDLDSNASYAQTAEKYGFEYALTQIRFMAGYGADNQHESVSFSQAILHHTERLIVMAALLPGPWNPAVAAKQIASIDNYSKGRIAVNVVSGWFKQEFTSIGQWWLDHAERYRRSREFIACLKGIWTEDAFTFKGDFYQFHDYPLKPKPVSRPGRPWPEIFQGGNSIDARENAAAGSDYYFMNGNTLEGFQSQIADVKERAKQHGREGQVKFAVNGFVIARETEEEAIRVLQEIQGNANEEAVEAFRNAVQSAGASTANKTGMWADSKLDDLVQYNDGFKTKLIGTPEQIADRILLIKSLGVDILLVAFLHYEDDIQQFGEEVLSRVRELEAQGRGKDEAFEVSLTGDVYRARKKEETKK
ncbi:MAG: hypothetical protein Q9168_008082 [Polycauliona sp. 1 TL-2023]